MLFWHWDYPIVSPKLLWRRIVLRPAHYIDKMINSCAIQYLLNYIQILSKPLCQLHTSWILPGHVWQWRCPYWMVRGNHEIDIKLNNCKLDWCLPKVILVWYNSITCSLDMYMIFRAYIRNSSISNFCPLINSGYVIGMSCNSYSEFLHSFP